MEKKILRMTSRAPSSSLLVQMWFDSISQERGSDTQNQGVGKIKGQGRM